MPSITQAAGAPATPGIYSDTIGEPIVVPRDTWLADVTSFVEPLNNTTTEDTIVRANAGPVGGPYAPYGAPYVIPAGTTGNLQVLGDIAPAPIPAGSEVYFTIEVPIGAGAITDPQISARART